MKDDLSKEKLERYLHLKKRMNETQQDRTSELSPAAAIRCAAELYQLLPPNARSAPTEIENWHRLRRALSALGRSVP